MKGRKLGQTEISIEEIETIAEMTKKNAFRREIAEKVKRSVNTVWRYQKKLGLI